MSRVGVLSRLRNAVRNLATYIWFRQSFVAISFERCRYFLAHVASRKLPWQGLIYVKNVINVQCLGNVTDHFHAFIKVIWPGTR